MSDTGLYSNLYERIRSVAALVDRVIMALSQGKRTEDDDLRQLSDLLTGGKSPLQSVSHRLLSAIVEEANSNLRLRTIGCELQQSPIPDQVIKDLEQLATVLDNERAAALYQLRK